MENLLPTVRTAVKRASCETYLLISLTSFAGSVIITRLFLELTGYPQLGGGELHIAHAVWGGLLLLAASLLLLILANRWAFIWSALLSGLGVGLFIDEIGKFITHQNDYFYPPAAPLVYAFFLLMVMLFLLVRRPGAPDPRGEMYRALAGLRELLDNNLDTFEPETLLIHLDAAKLSGQPHVAGLATALRTYLDETDIPLLPARPSLWHRLSAELEEWGARAGQRRHRALIVLAMAVVGVGMFVTDGLLVFVARSPEAANQTLLALFMPPAEVQRLGDGFWFYLRLFLGALVGLLALVAIWLVASGREQKGMDVALLALLISLCGVVLLSFYLDQFSAVATALAQFGVLLLVLAYRHWYLDLPADIEV
jgi:hypothetical protein